MRNIKNLGRSIVCHILERQVRALRRKHTFTIVTVSGSIGKTSTKFATAQILEASGKRVRFQDGNYNDRVTVPLVLFGHAMPGLFNILAWLRIFAQNARIVRQGPAYDVAVLELGTDGPGQIGQFAYLAPEVAVVTAVTPEHMEYFADLDAVAREEFAVARFAKRLLVNADDTATQYLEPHTGAMTYSVISPESDFYAKQTAMDLRGAGLEISESGQIMATTDTRLLGQQGAKISLAAAAAARLVGLDWEEISNALPKLEPAPGRLNLFEGQSGMTLIDDTYNASPEAVVAALDVLVSAPGDKKIAVLGGMNELGSYSPDAHKLVADAINKRPIDAVVVKGELAARELAPHIDASRQVIIRRSAQQSALAVREACKGAEHPVVLLKGSQNGVFAEEVTKELLANPSDAARLVRQSPAWLRKKHQFEEAAILTDTQ